MGVGPRLFSASICSFEPYPLFCANPYPGRISSYCIISLSLVTFAMMLAAAIDTLFASPLMIGTWGSVMSGIVTASFKRSSGSVERLSTAWRIASATAVFEWMASFPPRRGRNRRFDQLRKLRRRLNRGFFPLPDDGRRDARGELFFTVLPQNARKIPL